MERNEMLPEVSKEKKPIDIDLSTGIVPKSYDELMQFASLYKASGLAPASLKEVSQIAIAIGMCIELGRPILTGLADMAVINGKVGIFGDAALSVVRGSGKLSIIKEWSEGKPRSDEWIFYCMIARTDESHCDNDTQFPKCRDCPIRAMCDRVGVWTWLDAKAAGFHDPKQRDGRPDNFSPWRRFTKRMMQFKARNFILRDKFGDVLRGISTVEDLQDVIEMEPAGDSYQVGKSPEEKAEDLTNALKPKEKPEHIKGNVMADPEPPEEDKTEENFKPPSDHPTDPEEIRKLFINQRKSKTGRGGLEKWVMENTEWILSWFENPELKETFKELKNKFAGLYSNKAWNDIFAPLIEKQKPDEPEEEYPPFDPDDDEPEGAVEQPYEVCSGCTTNPCGAAYNLTFINADNKRTCLKKEYANPEGKPADKTPAEQYTERMEGKRENESENGNDYITCKKLKNQPRKPVDFCDKCFYSSDCKEYQDYLAAKA